MNEFKTLVKQMREAQKKYFKTKEKFWLQRAKNLEKQVDTQLTENETPNLFN